MNTLAAIKKQFHDALTKLVDEDPSQLVGMIGSAQDAKFGDYQANCAMPLGKKLSKSPRDVAAELIELVDLSKMCEQPEIAGPGFINLKLKTDWLATQLESIRRDDQLGVTPTTEPRTVIVDFSSPNVAKPMHVGHIRSTVIGDSLCRTLRFLGHTVVSDNHLGDWGTQFGMIIYGYRNFINKDSYEENSVQELGRVYREVRALMDYHAGVAALPKQETRLADLRTKLVKAEEQPESGDAKADKKARKALGKLRDEVKKVEKEIVALQAKLATTDNDPAAKALAAEHKDISKTVLQETAKLHAGDEANRQLWEDFLPRCRDEIDRIYKRLDVSFDEELGESFYHDRLANVVTSLEKKGLAKESDGATCVFLEGYEAPMIVRKKDGAFLYATTDLATIEYRAERWNPDAILYVVDFRQGEHFNKLFDVARICGHDEVELKHVSFGTVLGEDNKPLKTRSGVLISLDSLLDEAVQRAYKVVSENDDAKRNGAELDEATRKEIANVIGHAAIKYADLSQNRTSDYVFSYDKMVAMQGNTATYLQYSYARVQSIIARGQVDIQSLRDGDAKIELNAATERNLALQIVRFHEALDEVLIDYRPNMLANYLYHLAKAYAQFFDECPVLKAENDQVKNSRLLLCDIVGRIMKQGLQLLGIQTVDRM